MASLSEVVGVGTKQTQSYDMSNSSSVNIYNTPNVAKVSDMSNDVENLVSALGTFAKTKYAMSQDAMETLAVEHRIMYLENKNRILNNTDRNIDNGDTLRTPEEQKNEITELVRSLNDSAKEQINNDDTNKSIYDKSFTYAIKEDFTSTLGKLHSIDMEQTLRKKEDIYKSKLSFDWKNYTVGEATNDNKTIIQAGLKTSDTVKSEVLNAKIVGLTNDVKHNENTSYFNRDGSPNVQELSKVFKEDFKLYATKEAYDNLDSESKKYFVTEDNAELEELLMAKSLTNTLNGLSSDVVNINTKKQVLADREFMTTAEDLALYNEVEFVMLGKDILAGKYKDKVSSGTLMKILGEIDAIHRRNGLTTPSSKSATSTGTKEITDNGKAWATSVDNGFEISGKEFEVASYKLNQFKTEKDIDKVYTNAVETINATEKNKSTAVNKVNALTEKFVTFKKVYNAIKNNTPINQLTGNSRNIVTDLRNQNAIISYNNGDLNTAGNTIATLNTVPESIKTDIVDLMNSSGVDSIQLGVNKLIGLSQLGSKTISKDPVLNAYLKAISNSTENKKINFEKLNKTIMLASDYRYDNTSKFKLRQIGGDTLNKDEYDAILLEAKYASNSANPTESQLRKSYDNYIGKYTSTSYGVKVTNRETRNIIDGKPYVISKNSIDHILYYGSATTLSKYNPAYKGKKLKDVIEEFNVHSDGSATINIDGTLKLNLSAKAVKDLADMSYSLGESDRKQKGIEAVKKQQEYVTRKTAPKIIKTKQETGKKIKVVGNDFLKETNNSFIKVK